MNDEDKGKMKALAVIDIRSDNAKRCQVPFSTPASRRQAAQAE